VDLYVVFITFSVVMILYRKRNMRLKTEH
jgi:hypothetical protein